MLPYSIRQRLAGKPIVNGGVIAGTPAGIEKMCRAKLDIALKTPEWTKHTTGLDNISTNVIAHGSLAGACIVMPNHEVVANIYRDASIHMDSDGKIRCGNSKPSPIVHMYDRQRELLARVNQMYDVKQDPGLSLNQDRSVGKASRLSGLLHWLKLGRIYLTGKP